MGHGSTTCCITGGGPAGMVLGLLLARAGIEVVVLEKHRDFLRDFRGDTVHPSTLEVLDDLGLAERFLALPHRRAPAISLITDAGPVTFGDQRQLSRTFPFLAFVPQWDFLSLLAEEAARYPNFHLRMGAEATDLLRAGDQAVGVRYRDEGGTHELRASLTVAADGRNSTLRTPAALVPRDFGAPMDALWFRLPLRPQDPADTFARLGHQRILVGINRETYWQCAYVIPKGGYGELRARGVTQLRSGVGRMAPWLGDRTGELDFDRTSMLEVRVDRLRRWYRPGLLFIGDAAHAMSPIGGVGVNLAVQDAVAAANQLAGPLLHATVTASDLAAVQRRRLPPTALVQRLQLALQSRLVAPTLQGQRPSRPPMFLKAAARVKPLGRLVAHMVGYGPRPERVRTPAVPANRSGPE
ncbi:FAD-dependent oxidoreductase [Streptomyces sp. NPDC006879]|uniref:FAD-dependent oxidoreductase n=1 Tax=Streptomyces sp. NPDC006879 TaxID=3364767 RepID=UPI0036B6C788